MQRKEAGEIRIGFGGTVVMSGFWLATLPMLIATGLGIPLLSRRATSDNFGLN